MVDLKFASDRGSEAAPRSRRRLEPTFSIEDPSERRHRKIFKYVFGTLGLIILVALIGGAVYYQSLKQTPQYSLALLVDAAKRDDRAEINSLVDIDQIVNNFIPQVLTKALDLYGRGQPPELLAKMVKLAQPLMPAVKERAKVEIPRVIRERTERFGYVPFFAMVMGADRYLDVQTNGDTAFVRSKIPEHPLEMTMKKKGSRWQIVGVNDEPLAQEIATTIGQQVIEVATSGDKKAADKYGMGNLSDLLKQAQELIK